MQKRIGKSYVSNTDLAEVTNIGIIKYYIEGDFYEINKKRCNYNWQRVQAAV